MKRVLIVDDSMFMRLAISKILENNGYTIVGQAENGKAAVSQYKELLPDVVTMDITMHEMDGLMALKEIIEYDGNAKVVMVSAMGQRLMVEEAAATGAKGFLVKPFQEEAVVAALGRLF